MKRDVKDRLFLLRQRALIVKDNTQLRHIPDKHDLSKCTENTQLVQPSQERVITKIK